MLVYLKTEMTSLTPRLRGIHAIATGAGAVTALIGGGHLAAWLSGLMAQRGFSAITMKTNTALCLLLLGLSLVMLVPVQIGRTRRWAGRTCAALALVVGILTLSENLIGWNLRIDQLLAQEPLGALGMVQPNRMGTPASICVSLAGMALLLLRRENRRIWAAQWLALAVCLGGLLCTIGYLYNVQWLYGAARFTAIAWPTAASLLVLGLGLLCARPAEGWMAQITAADAGGSSIRRLLIPALLLPVGLGWLRLAGERHGLFDAAMGTALVMLTFIIVFSSLVYHAGRRVSRSAAALYRREQDLRQLNRTLKALGSSNQAMLRAKDESEYVKEVCRIVVEECGHAMVWLGYAEQDENKTVRPVAYAGFDQGYIQSLQVTWADSERGRGPTGTAIRTGKVSMCRNMLTDPAFGPWRQQALRRGYASSIVLPLIADGQTFGALSIYSKDADPFSGDEVRLLSDLAGDMAYGITAIRLRESHAKAEQDLRELSENLRRSNQDLEQFAYVASHDLQEPLRMVAGYLQLIERRYKDRLDQDAREFIGFAVDGATRMSRLITDLLEYSRINTRGRPPEPVATETVLAQALKNLQVSIAETGAVITHDPLPTICGDGPQLVQLLQNLIGNAIKFRHPEQACRIHISAERKDREWVFSVRDNGIGIDPQYAERIFLIFQRLHSRKQYPGTGIGLAICKRIVERHGGRIWVESTLGQGSAFFFTVGA